MAPNYEKAPKTVATPAFKYSVVPKINKVKITSIVGANSDFWLLGGASILLWLIMALAETFRGTSWSIQHQLMNLPFFFATFSLLVNYPHFLISYKLGYGRGGAFVRRNWFSLIVVPLVMIGFFALAFFSMNGMIDQSLWVNPANKLLSKTDLVFRFGDNDIAGRQILSGSIMLMFLTVGWHYSKQVFGCMMVYSHYDKYPLTRVQRNLLKSNLFSIAVVNFLYSNKFIQAGANLFNVPLPAIEVPEALMVLAYVWFGLSLVVVLGFIILKNWRRLGKKPGANFLVSWLALIIWWVPAFRITDYYLFAAPFFHSLQYLPFAYRLESPRPGEVIDPQARKRFYYKGTLKVVALLVISFLCFEGIPGALDQTLRTKELYDTWFFLLSAAVFINVHHFFIDSVTWKFSDPRVAKGLLG